MDARGVGGRGRARGPERGGRGRARGPERGRRGRAAGPDRGRGRGRGRVPGVQVLQELQVGNIGVHENVPNGVFGVPENLLNQNPEVDQLNVQLSAKYTDIQNMRDAIAELRQMVPNDQVSHEKIIEVCLEEYREMRSRCVELRNRIRKMDPPGIPFEEPEGFDVMP